MLITTGKHLGERWLRAVTLRREAGGSRGGRRAAAIWETSGGRAGDGWQPCGLDGGKISDSGQWNVCGGKDLLEKKSRGGEWRLHYFVNDRIPSRNTGIEQFFYISLTLRHGNQLTRAYGRTDEVPTTDHFRKFGGKSPVENNKSYAMRLKCKTWAPYKATKFTYVPVYCSFMIPSMLSSQKGARI